MPSSASATTTLYTLSLHDALPICGETAHDEGALVLLDELLGALGAHGGLQLIVAEEDLDLASEDAVLRVQLRLGQLRAALLVVGQRLEEHTSELQSLRHLVCRLLLPPPPRSTLFPYTTLFRSAARPPTMKAHLSFSMSSWVRWAPTAGFS